MGFGGAGQGRPTLGANAAARSEGVPVLHTQPHPGPISFNSHTSPRPPAPPHTHSPAGFSWFPSLGMKLLPREGCACAPLVPAAPGAAPRVQGSLGRGSGPGLPATEVTHLPRVGSRGPGCPLRPLPVARLCPGVHRCGICPPRRASAAAPLRRGLNTTRLPATPGAVLVGKGVGQVNGWRWAGGALIRKRHSDIPR